MPALIAFTLTREIFFSDLTDFLKCPDVMLFKKREK
jgi:hypothetical protein